MPPSFDHTPGPGDLNAPPAATEPARRHLSPTQRDQIARLLVWGMPAPQIAAAYGVHPQTIAKLDNSDDDMAARKLEVASNLNKLMVLGRFGFLEGLDEAMDIARRVGLRSQDPRTQLETAKWWIARTLPEPKSTTVVEHAGEVGVKLPDGLAEAVGEMTRTLASLQSVELPPPDTHVRRDLPRIQIEAPGTNGNGGAQ